ncbi:hypothetical protein AJ80_03951 [Polytolypa hystricis UAMH7299]|uniref:Autophagy-related protein 16 domain-containing protein n=1 Tax=Polytolypa hystricis (strain UAMH7299) TaxID=1447883 RepID=A0A2B7YE32_POLH7|nr:hypothetical protein AJ80_03951 [Polytolypa hystricis UAMH7299]
MSNWKEEYFAALGVRDQREKANIALYDAYTRLADRTSAIQQQQQAQSSSTSSLPQPPNKKLPSKPDPSSAQPPPTGPITSDVLTTTLKELSEAQKSRTDLLDKLSKTTSELEKLKKKTSTDARRIADLSGERAHFQVRIKDRDEELRGKTKLLDDLHAEVVSLNLQFNMAEDRAKKMEQDNQELVDRWMAQKRHEADEMNKTSKFS